MAETAVILVLVGLTALASAYTFGRPRFDHDLQTKEHNEGAHFIEQLQGIQSNMHTHVY